jgi:hypothetical protein
MSNYTGLQTTCHPLSFRIPTFLHFGQHGISQLSTSEYRSVVTVQHFMSYNSLCTRFKKTGVLSIDSHCEMSTGVGGEENGWSYKVRDIQEFE